MDWSNFLFLRRPFRLCVSMTVTANIKKHPTIQINSWVFYTRSELNYSGYVGQLTPANFSKQRTTWHE